VLFPLCFCLALAAAVARDTFDMRVFTPEDIERTLGLPPIGVLFNRDEVTDEVSSEYLFRIAATLDHARRTAEVKTIAVTSVKPRGGTSTIVDLVAAELAQLGNRVLVLDASGTREPVAFIPPDEDAAGANTRARTLHPDLGPYLHSRGRLLPSVHAITRSFRETHGDYDILLLDCQPLFVSADTEYLARMADATLLVVESGMVLKQDLLRAARLLERLPVSSIAVVLNQLKLERADASLREDLREFVTFGRGFAHGKPIPLTTTRHADYPVTPPGGSGTYQAQEPPAYVPPAQESKLNYPLPSHHENVEHLEDDRSDSRNGNDDDHDV
jgi:Mrp family chromosome partitioning ATPase